MDFTKKLGLKIKELRAKSELTQDQLAELAGMSGKYLGEVERGEVNVSVVILYKLAKVLNIKISEFFDLDYLNDTKSLRNELSALINEASDDDIRQLYRIVLTILK